MLFLEARKILFQQIYYLSSFQENLESVFELENKEDFIRSITHYNYPNFNKDPNPDLFLPDYTREHLEFVFKIYREEYQKSMEYEKVELQKRSKEYLKSIIKNTSDFVETFLSK